MRARNAHVFALGSEIGLGKTAAIPQTASADCDLVDVSFDDLPVPNLETVSLDYFVDVYIEQPNPVRLRLQMLRRLLRLLQRALTAFMRSFQTLNETLQFVVRNAPSLIVAGFHPPDIPPAFTFSFMNQLGALAA